MRWIKNRRQILAAPRWMKDPASNELVNMIRVKLLWEVPACIICGLIHEPGKCQQVGLVLHSTA